MRAVCSVINKARVAKGWGVLTAQEAEVTATVWIEILDAGRVPYEHYEELYRRAMQSRAAYLSRGDQPPEITPEFLVGLWTGPNGLSADVADRNPARLLTENARGGCEDCDGTGWKRINKDGYWGVTRCPHGEDKKHG